MLTVRDKNFLKKDCGSENLSISSYKDFGNLSADRTKAFVNFSNVEVQDDRVFFVLSGVFFSCAFTFHRTAGEGGGYPFSPSLPLPPASQTLRHQPGDCCRELTSARSQQLDSNQEPLVSERKSLNIKIRAVKCFTKFNQV